VVTSGDVLRLVFYLLVFIAVGTAIRDDLRKLRGANSDLVRLREADAQRISAEERARLAREIHDGLVQDLWLARLTSGRIAEVSRIPSDARAMLNRLDATLESAQGEARQALITLQAHTDTHFGELFRRFVDDYADRFDIDVERAIDDSVQPPTEVQGELLRVCREALNNVRKHADATKVNVELRREGSSIRLVVRDNGKGFDPASLNGRGFGMESMRQRAQKIAGQLEVRSQPMGGTTVDLELPLAAASATI
jgi:signal transduction histidine kinase